MNVLLHEGSFDIRNDDYAAESPEDHDRSLHGHCIISDQPAVLRRCRGVIIVCVDVVRIMRMHHSPSPPPMHTTTDAASPFLSIKEAAIRYQKAEITIRRLVRATLQKEKSPDRMLIHPLPQEVARLKKSRRPFAYTIAQELLEKQFGSLASPNVPRHSFHGYDPYLQLLEKTNRDLGEQLKVKDEQIRVLSQAIDDLSERQREANILMKGLQETLLLSAPTRDVVELQSSGEDAARRRRWWRFW